MNDKNHKIYIIIFPEGEIYIGQTKRSLEERWCDGYKGCVMMHEAILKYGKHNPNIKKEIIKDNLTQKEANEMERYYISYYKNKPNTVVLNEQTGGKSGFTVSKQVKDKISKSEQEYYKNHPEKAIKHSEYMKKYFLEHPEEIKRAIEVGKKNHEKYPELKRAACKKIIQYTYDMKYVASYDSLREASKITGISEISISACLCNTNQVTAGNYRWYYDDGKVYPLIYYRQHDNKPVKVIQKDKNTGNIIYVYDSILEASKKTGVPRSNISKALKQNNGLAGGFIWDKT